MKVLMATMKMDIGGAETHILEAARALKKQGVEVTVVSAGGVFEGELAASGIRHIYAPLHTKNPGAVLRAYRILDALLKSEAFDVVHAHARIPAVICHALCRKHNIRFVTTAHLTFTVNALWRRLMHWGERTVAVSDDIRQYLIDEYGCSSDNITVTINGINTDVYSPDTDASGLIKELSLTAGKRRIVLVSRIDTDRSEAAVQLADIAPRLYEAEKNLEILIVGGGNDFERLRTSAENANRAVGFELVRLAGPRTDISRCIAAGDIFVGVSRAALEAMAMAKPVVLAGNEGYFGVFTKDKFGVAYDSNFCCRGCPMTSRDSLFRDLAALLAMPQEELDRLGRDGREIVQTHYSVERMARDYLAMYEAVRPYAPYRWGDILMCGYYGFGNMGDDSLLRAIIEGLRREDPDVRITVMSRSPKKTAAVYGVHAVNRMDPVSVYRAMKHGSLFLFGGGNLLQDGSSARSLWYYTTVLRLAGRCGMKRMVYANGIGPLGTEKSRRAAAAVLADVDLVTLREEDSLARCEELGIRREKLRLTADPVFTLREADEAWTARLCGGAGIRAGKRYFAVALREPKTDGAEMRAAMARICRRIYDTYGYIPVFIPMQEPADGAVNRETAALCGCRWTVVTGVTGSEMLGILRRMEFVVSMRLHMLIYSAAVGVPSVGLAYDCKLQAFTDRMGLPCLAEDTDEEAFLACVGGLISDRDAISTRLRTDAARMSALAQEDAKAAVMLSAGGKAR